MVLRQAGGHSEVGGARRPEGVGWGDMNTKVVDSPELYSRISNVTLNLTRSQWSCWGKGVLWWNEGVLVMIRAVEFWTS